MNLAVALLVLVVCSFTGAVDQRGGDRDNVFTSMAKTRGKRSDCTPDFCGLLVTLGEAQEKLSLHDNFNVSIKSLEKQMTALVTEHAVSEAKMRDMESRLTQSENEVTQLKKENEALRAEHVTMVTLQSQVKKLQEFRDPEAQVPDQPPDQQAQVTDQPPDVQAKVTAQPPDPEAQVTDQPPELFHPRIHKVDLTFDPDTAYPILIVSEDGKQVRRGGTKQNLPDNPKRFARYSNVLTKEGFSSGRFYYEVDVKDSETFWTLGVVKESVERKRWTFLTPSEGFWTLQYTGTEYKAPANPSVFLSLKKPQKVGVYVDFEQGEVSFYDVTNYTSLIYAYTRQRFNEKLYPFFSPGSETNYQLTITPVSI